MGAIHEEKRGAQDLRTVGHVNKSKLKFFSNLAAYEHVTTSLVCRIRERTENSE